MLSVSLFSLVISFVLYFYAYINGGFYFSLSILIFLFYLSRWFSDVIIESTYQGHHTNKVRFGISFGMVLFILSEIMFFFSFF
jgi:cytochrome c oxidase subunit 3